MTRALELLKNINLANQTDTIANNTRAIEQLGLSTKTSSVSVAFNSDGGGAYENMAKFKQLKNDLKTQVEAQGGAFALVNTGDMWEAGAMWHLQKATRSRSYRHDGVKYLPHSLGYLDYDVSALGNHEFDEGLDELHFYIDEVSRVAKTHHKFVAANMDFTGNVDAGYDKGNKVHVDNGKLGKSSLLNLSGPLSDTHPVLFIGLNHLSFVQADDGMTITTDLDAIVTIVENEITNNPADLVVILSHMGFETDTLLINKLNANRAKVHCVIGGGSGQFMHHNDTRSKPEYVAPVYYTPDSISEAGFRDGGTASEPTFPKMIQDASGGTIPFVHINGSFKYLGLITFDIDGQNVSLNMSKSDVFPINDARFVTVGDSLVDNVLTPMYTNQTYIAESAPIGTSSKTMNHFAPNRYSHEHSGGNFFADSLEYIGSQSVNPLQRAVGFCGNSDLRGTINAKDMPFNGLKLLDIQPFDNAINYMELTPLNFKQLLEVSVHGLLEKTTDGTPNNLYNRELWDVHSMWSWNLAVEIDVTKPAFSLYKTTTTTTDSDGKSVDTDTYTTTQTGTRIRNVRLNTGTRTAPIWESIVVNGVPQEDVGNINVVWTRYIMTEGGFFLNQTVKTESGPTQLVVNETNVSQVTAAKMYIAHLQNGNLNYDLSLHDLAYSALSPQQRRINASGWQPYKTNVSVIYTPENKLKLEMTNGTLSRDLPSYLEIPSTNFVVGQTVEIDLSDASLSGYGFQLSLPGDGSTAYVTGVTDKDGNSATGLVTTGAAGDKITFVPTEVQSAVYFVLMSNNTPVAIAAGSVKVIAPLTVMP